MRKHLVDFTDLTNERDRYDRKNVERRICLIMQIGDVIGKRCNLRTKEKEPYKSGHEKCAVFSSKPIKF